MATERTILTPDGDVIFLEVDSEQYLTPAGIIIDGDLEAGGSIAPIIHYNRQQQG